MGSHSEDGRRNSALIVYPAVYPAGNRDCEICEDLTDIQDEAITSEDEISCRLAPTAFDESPAGAYPEADWLK